MERKLIDYLPYAVRDFKEYEGIMESEQPEFDQAWGNADDLLNNQFISTAGNMGLSRWEKAPLFLHRLSPDEKAPRSAERGAFIYWLCVLHYALSSASIWVRYFCW